MQAVDHVGNKMTTRSDERDSTLTQGVVNAVVEDRSEGVSDQRREEN